MIPVGSRWKSLRSEREDRVACEALVPARAREPDRDKQFRNDEQKNLPFPGSEQTPRGGKVGGS
jgi:hypothetical protein